MKKFLGILLLSLMLFLFCKAKNIEYGIRFLPNIKIISNYLIMGSIISGVVAFILSFFINNNNAYLISVWGLLVVIFIRTLLLIILAQCLPLLTHIFLLFK